jgi:hypothetical protein
VIPYHFHPEADSLGFRFLDEVQRKVTSIREHPEIGFPLGARIRVVPLHGFPYSVVYHFNGRDVRILAIAAQARRPGYWRNRRVAR